MVGIYPLLADETCWFLALDFDGPSWTEDATALLGACRELEAPVALERSRSGNGGHVWMFFPRLARGLPTKIAPELATKRADEDRLWALSAATEQSPS